MGWKGALLAFGIRGSGSDRWMGDDCLAKRGRIGNTIACWRYRIACMEFNDRGNTRNITTIGQKALVLEE